MNKKLVDSLLPDAVAVLKDEEIGIAKAGKIDKNFRGHISSFGAAVSMGSLLAAAAFFSQQGRAKNPREKLMQELNWLLKNNKEMQEYWGKSVKETLFDTIRTTPAEKQSKLKSDVLACAVALKLGMNLYELTDDSKKQEAGD